MRYNITAHDHHLYMYRQLYIRVHIRRSAHIRLVVIDHWRYNPAFCGSAGCTWQWFKQIDVQRNKTGMDIWKAPLGAGVSH